MFLFNPPEASRWQVRNVPDTSHLCAEVGFKPAYITFPLQIKRTPHESGTFINFFSEMIVNQMQRHNCALASHAFRYSFRQITEAAHLMLICFKHTQNIRVDTAHDPVLSLLYQPFVFSHFSRWFELLRVYVASFLRWGLECHGLDQASRPL